MKQRHRSGRVPKKFIPEVRAAVMAAILADGALKTIALTVGLRPTDVCRLANKLGFRRMYVTAEERAEVLARRAASVVKEIAA